MRSRLLTWMSVLLVATFASSPLGALTVQARCITQHHACETAAVVPDCCCKHVSTDEQSAVTLTKPDPQCMVSYAAILPHVERSSYAVPIDVVRRLLPRSSPHIDRVTMFGTLLI